MKKIMFLLLSFGLLCVIGFAVAERSQAADTELRPMQKVMRERAGWIKAITDNLGQSNKTSHRTFKQATALASQAAKVAEKLSDPLARELTLKLSVLATKVADAATRKDGDTAKLTLIEIKAVCSECHAKIRDKN